MNWVSGYPFALNTCTTGDPSIPDPTANVPVRLSVGLGGGGAAVTVIGPARAGQRRPAVTPTVYVPGGVEGDGERRHARP